ncbi:MAG: hypothetical protein H0U76_12630 [Ktedonobacteraceae bacterium]|nr:hypothetical protein [Ktedonobacteraceae bacterium]
MTTTEQKQKILKAKVALAMQDEFGRVPKEADIEYTFRLARVLYKAVLGTHYIKRQQQKTGQLPLF